jgi:hypothetical protein
MMIDVMGSLKKSMGSINPTIHQFINHHQPSSTHCQYHWVFFRIVVAATRKPLLLVWHPPLPPLPGAAQRIQNFKTLMW